jgi:hypothetical protein
LKKFAWYGWAEIIGEQIPATIEKPTFLRLQRSERS